MRARLAMLFLLACIASACQSDGRRDGDASNADGKTIHGFGRSLELPSGWHGRIGRASPAFAVSIEAATVPLVHNLGEPASATYDLLAKDDVLIQMDDIGRAPAPILAGESREGWEVLNGPLEFKTSDFRGPFKGVPRRLAAAVKPVVIQEHLFHVYVVFGRRPATPALVGEANAVLATFAL